MRALTFHAPGDVRLERVIDPALAAPTDVLVQVECAAICGSDLHIYRGREAGLDAGTVLGHEMVGVVVEVGSEVGGLAPGQRVVCPFTTSCGACSFCHEGLTARCTRGQLLGWRQGGEGLHGAQCELVRVPLAESTLVPLPAELDPELALLAADVLPTGLYAADLAQVGPGATVAVVGCGPVGLMAAVGAHARGAARVLAVDGIAGRRALASRLGAQPLAPEDAAAAVQEATAGRGADAVLEAVGSPEASRLALALARPGGRIGAVGVHHERSFAFPPAALYDKNLTYAAGRCPARHYLPEALALLAAGRWLFADLFTHRLPLAEGPRGYEIFDRRLEGCVKVMLVP